MTRIVLTRSDSGRKVDTDVAGVLQQREASFAPSGDGVSSP
jgi:hypothetical protein